MKEVIIIVFFVLPSILQCDAQHAKRDTINEVVVTDKKVVAPPASSQQIQSSISQYYQQASLQHLLQLHTNVFVKNYGIGSLSTISIRGSSAAQTQVLWHGVNINNAMTGLSDFSAIPVSFFDKISIDYGSASSNPAMSGCIQLSNDKPSFYKHKKIQAAFGYENLKNYTASIGIATSNRLLSNRLRVNISKAKNEFTFFNTDKQQTDTLTHAQSNQISVMNDLSLKINNRFILSWHVWAQHQQREIPPAIFEASSVKMETTTAYRTLVKLEQHRYQSYSSTTTLGVFYEQYAYDDSLIQLRSQASVTNIPFIEQFNLILPRRQKVSLQLIANRSFLTGHTNYSLNKAGIIASYSVDQLLKHINLQTSIEKEVTDVFQVPLIANVSLNWDAWHFIKPYVTVSSHYRMPTLNELYYNPGGNINLKPETSKNLEGGFQLNKKWQTQTLHTDLTLFNRKVNNWIAWYGASILTPHNIQQVWSRGLEFIGHYDINLASRRQNDYPKDSIMMIEVCIAKKSATNRIEKRRTVSFDILYAYTLSTTEESAIRNDYSIGKQIPYVPRYQLKGNIGLKWDQFELSYVHTYTGYRFITSDESQYLKPYGTGNVFASYKYQINTNLLHATLRFNNLWNARYESIAGRIMPGRNISIGIMWEMQ